VVTESSIKYSMKLTWTVVATSAAHVKRTWLVWNPVIVKALCAATIPPLV